MTLMPCGVCGLQFRYSQGDTSPLLEHIAFAHPRVDVAGFGTSDDDEVGSYMSKITGSVSGRAESEQTCVYTAEFHLCGCDGGRGRPHADGAKSRAKNIKSASTGRLSVDSLDGEKSNRKKETKSMSKIESDYEQDMKEEEVYTTSYSNATLPNDNPETKSKPSKGRVKKLPKSTLASDKLTDRGKKKKKRSKSEEIIPSSADLGAVKQSKLLCPKTVAKTKGKRKDERVFKTGVESWWSGTSPMLCPACGARKTPIVRRYHNKHTSSTLGAVCMLCCWPLMLLCGTTETVNLFCPICNHYLGTLDKDSTVQRPPTPGDIMRNQDPEK